jgi:RNA polymerase sigma factor (sigma-70 family)
MPPTERLTSPTRRRARRGERSHARSSTPRTPAGQPRPTRGDYAARNAELFARRSEVLAELDGVTGDTSADTSRRRQLLGRLDKVTAEIVEANRGLVRSYVNRFASHTSAEDSRDFENAGLVGLIRAINTYDPTKGPFAQWAYRPIKREVLRSVHSTDFQNMNAGDFERRPDIIRAREELLAEGVNPTDEQVAAKASATLGQVQRVLGAPQLSSLSAPMGTEDGDANLGDLVGDEEPDPLEQVITAMSVSALESRGLPVLSDREMFVIVRRFGLDGEPPQRLSTIGEHLKLSREAARQIESKALAKLAHPNVLAKLVLQRD